MGLNGFTSAGYEYALYNTEHDQAAYIARRLR